MTMPTALQDRILNRAAEDSEFRARLIADPGAAISAETGQTIPDGFAVVVHEDTSTTAHVVLPPSPALTEAELELAAGANLWQKLMAPGYKPGD